MSKPHRVWFKNLLNPIFRKLGFSIVSIFDGDKLLGYKLMRYPKYCEVIKDDKI